MNSVYDAQEARIDPPYEEQKRIEKAMEAFDAYVIGGVVYATYEDCCLIKDYIAAYDAKH